MVGSDSSSSENEVIMDSKKLLDFYQNKFDQIYKKEDRYKEKIDKHLKELIEDRYELEAEVTRKGEKISNLQKALVELQLSCFEEKERFLRVSAENEQLKRNEELLHRNIRQLLSHTKDRNLRDQIIYVLQDPDVEILCRHVEGTSAGTSASSLTKNRSKSDLLKEQIQQLQSDIDEYSRISKNNSDVIMEDCRVALEKSRDKIVEDEQEIRKLQKQLQESQAEICNLKQKHSESQSTERDNAPSLHPKHISKSAEQLPRARVNVSSSSKSDEGIYKASDPSSNIKDLKFSLASITQVSSKINSLLRNIKSTETFIYAAKQPVATMATKYAAETDIVELQNCIRQTTRLIYDINTIWETLSEEIAEHQMPVRTSDVEQLNNALSDLNVKTVETELITMGLGRNRFFDYLVNRTISLSELEIENSDACDHLKCAADVVTLEEKVKSAVVTVKTATDIIERIDRNIKMAEKRKNMQNLTGRRFEEKQTDTIQQSGSETSIKTVLESNNHRFQNEQMSDLNVRKIRNEPIGGGEVTRKIDKTLSKIRQIERKEYAKDNELCRHLAEQIRSLSDRLKELCDEYNKRNVQDNFTEYSAVTLSKLETLARQSRDTVIAAEAQISAYRSNAQVLSQKLKDTEELLRESIHECLALKQKLTKLEISRGPDASKVQDDARQTFLRTMNLRNTDRPNSADDAEQVFLRTLNLRDTDNTAQRTFFRTIDLDGNETTAKKPTAPLKSPRKPEGPFECMFCKQGSDHKHCIEKMRELNAIIRKLKVEVKTFEKEAKNEKKIAQANKEGAEKANFDLENEKQSAKETIAALESKNASLLDQLKVFKNRLKNMERYRRCEIEGLQTDIRNLKAKIKDLEKQLTRAVLIFENGQKDMELLKTIHTTAQRSKSTVMALKRLKAKIYEMETDIKRL